MAARAEYSPTMASGTEYLEAIYEMEEEGQRIQQARIARRLGVAPATVSEHVRRLEKEGLVGIEGRELRLTDLGRDVAIPLVRRHRLAERLLTDLLEIPWYRAHEEAHQWEHVMSPEVEERIITKTGARTCPHGNPIPGLEPPYDRRSLITLNDLGEGDRCVLQILTEDVELVTDVLRYFEEHKLMPGAAIQVRSVGPDGTMMLDVDGSTASLGPELADNLWVERAG